MLLCPCAHGVKSEISLDTGGYITGFHCDYFTRVKYIFMGSRYSTGVFFSLTVDFGLFECVIFLSIS